MFGAAVVDGNATLYINLYDARCGYCNRGANYHEERHDTVLGYYAKDAVIPAGCGVEWTHVASDYSGDGIEEMVKRCRPDLEYVDLWQK